MKTLKTFAAIALCVFVGLATATGYLQLIDAIAVLAPAGLEPYILMALLSVGIAGFLVIGGKIIAALDKRGIL